MRRTTTGSAPSQRNGQARGLSRSEKHKYVSTETTAALATLPLVVLMDRHGTASDESTFECHSIDTHQLIPRDSTQEVEIRAHCIYATALLAEEINSRREADQKIIIPQIDARIWTHYHTTNWPHHLTKTIMY